MDKEETVLTQDTDNLADSNDELSIMREEIKVAINKLKNNKSPGTDSISEEMIKNGGESVVDAYHILCNRILETGQWPDQWTESILIPIPKKKASKKCSEHRTISLISHPSKILLSIF